jgi:hypothetical protein
MQNKNKKGKSVGKRVLVGFTLDYSTAMNSQAAGLPANYQVTYNTTERVKKKRVPVSLPVDVQPNYNPTTHIVTLTIVGKQSFAKGGQVTVIATPPGGVSSATGAFLVANDTVFMIQPKASGIWSTGRG